MINKQFYLIVGIIVVIMDILLMSYLCKVKLKDNPKQKIKVILSMLMSIVAVVGLVAYILFC